MNVLLIFADQMHKFAMGCMGTPDVKTPNLDRLAASGVLFRNAYSNCPVCTPFRINLFTGMYASQTRSMQNGSRIPAGVTTLADLFNAGGFRTSFVGKWHIGASGNDPVPETLRGGFSRFLGYQCYNGFYQDVVFHDEHGATRHFQGHHRTDVTTDLAIERLEELAGDPFFMCVAYQAPHYPVQPAPEYERAYKGVSITRRGNSQNIDPYTPTQSPRSPRPKETCPDYQRYGNDLGEYLRLYHAMVTQVDANVARLLGALDRLGLTSNTAVIFTADHGDMQGAHGLKNKLLPHEESAGIPLIARIPCGAAGRVVEMPVSGVDYFPTCLDLAGLPPVDGLPGSSLAPVLRGEPEIQDRPVFSECKDWKMVRKGPFKLVVQGAARAPVDLFNLDNDSLEMHNLVADEDHHDVITTLSRDIDTMLAGLATATWSGAVITRHPAGAGIAVAHVPRESIASVLGFLAGDVVRAVNGVPVNDVMTFMNTMDTLQDAGDMVFTLERDGDTITIDL